MQAVSPQQREFRHFLNKYNLSKFEFRLERDCKVTSISQLRSIDDPSLTSISMSLSDIKKLRKFVNKEFPKGFHINKFKKFLSKLENHEQSQLSDSPLQLDVSDIAVNRTLSKKTYFGEIADAQLFLGTPKQKSVLIRRIQCKRIEAPLEVFINESKMAISLGSEYLMNALALVSSRDHNDDDEFIIVYEATSNLTLKQAFTDSVPCPTFSELRNFTLLHDYALQITEAMFYLEERKLVHGDLSLKKCLIFPNYKLKICDFGLSRAVGSPMQYYRGELTGPNECPLPWVAPERISPESLSEAEFSSYSDVWSYGFTLWELFSRGVTPWRELNNKQILAEVLAPQGKRPPPPTTTTSEYQAIIRNCWNHDPRQRPRFQTLELQLSNMKVIKVLASQCSDDECTLHYIENEIILLLEESPSEASPGYAIGANTKGETGIFNYAKCRPLSSSPTTPTPAATKDAVPLRQKQMPNKSSTISGASLQNNHQQKAIKRLTTSMISGPQNDMRHTGHVGCDGSTFGDVDKIAAKLPEIKVPPPIQNNGKDYSDGEFSDFDFGPSLMDEMMDLMNFGLNGVTEVKTETKVEPITDKPREVTAPIPMSTEMYRKQYTTPEFKNTISNVASSPRSAASSISFGCLDDDDDDDEEEVDDETDVTVTGSTAVFRDLETCSDPDTTTKMATIPVPLMSDEDIISDMDGSCKSLENINISDERFNEDTSPSTRTSQRSTGSEGIKHLSQSDQRCIDSAIEAITKSSDQMIYQSPTPVSALHQSSSLQQKTRGGRSSVLTDEERGRRAYDTLVGGSSTTSTTSTTSSTTTSKQRRSLRTSVAGIPISPSPSSSPISIDDTNPLRILRSQSSTISSSSNTTRNTTTSTTTTSNHYSSASKEDDRSPSLPPPRQSPVNVVKKTHTRVFPLKLDSATTTTSTTSTTTPTTASSGTDGAVVMTPPTPQQYSVRSVTETAKELGFNNNGSQDDSFWTIAVKFGDIDISMYEDNGSSPNYRTEEVLLMRKVLSRDVTVQDCCAALTECRANLTAAVKLLKLRQLISTRLTDSTETCKRVLVQSEWNVDEAANRLVKNDTSDIVHL